MNEYRCLFLYPFKLEGIFNFPSTKVSCLNVPDEICNEDSNSSPLFSKKRKKERRKKVCFKQHL